MFQIIIVFLSLIIPDSILFSVNNEVIGNVAPSDGGFWEIGKFSSQVGAVDNPWKYGNKMAPFDQPVSILI
jgi:hypothetical protein